MDKHGHLFFESIKCIQYPNMSSQPGLSLKIDKIADAEKEILRTALKVAQHHGLAIDLIKASPETTHHEADAFAPVCQGEQETLYPVAYKRNVSQQFVLLCRNLDLFAQERSAIEGSKFKAVNNRDRNFTKAKARAPAADRREYQALSQHAAYGRPNRASRCA